MEHPIFRSLPENRKIEVRVLLFQFVCGRGDGPGCCDSAAQGGFNDNFDFPSLGDVLAGLEAPPKGGAYNQVDLLEIGLTISGEMALLDIDFRGIKELR